MTGDRCQVTDFDINIYLLAYSLVFLVSMFLSTDSQIQCLPYFGIFEIEKLIYNFRIGF